MDSILQAVVFPEFRMMRSGEERILYHKRRRAQALRAIELRAPAASWERACRFRHSWGGGAPSRVPRQCARPVGPIQTIVLNVSRSAQVANFITHPCCGMHRHNGNSRGRKARGRKSRSRKIRKGGCISRGGCFAVWPHNDWMPGDTSPAPCISLPHWP